MSGILERIEAKLDQLLAGTAAIQANTAAQPTPAPLAPLAPVAPVAPPAAPLAQPQQQFGAVSAEQITALITPHVADPNLKAALQAQMAAMGIGALPDAQPHQYGELYARFQQVIAQFTAAAAAVPVAAAAPASII